MYLDWFKYHGKPYLRIVEKHTITINGSKKNKRQTIKNLGYLEKYDYWKSDFLKRMKQQNGELKIDGINANDFRVRAKLFNNAYFDNSFDNYKYLNQKKYWILLFRKYI